MNRLKILFVAVTSFALTVQGGESFGQAAKSGIQKQRQTGLLKCRFLRALQDKKICWLMPHLKYP